MQTNNQQPIVGAIGIELGSSKSIIGVAQRGGVSIITNDSSQRETLNFVSFYQNQRLIGEQAANKYFTRFLGIKSHAQFLKQEKQWIYQSMEENEQKQLMFSVKIDDQEQQLSSEQITGIFLKKLKDYVKTFGITHSDFVISVPSYFTEPERKAVLTAAQLADINVMRLFSESAASLLLQIFTFVIIYKVALDYGLFRKKELTTTPKNVLFIDFGQSKFSCFAGSFTNQNFQIIAQRNLRNLGVRDIDRLLFEKAKIRLLDAIAKARKVLSGIADTTIYVEMFMEDMDFSENLSRNDFDAIISPILNSIHEEIVNLKNELNSKGIIIQDVELVGGGTRIPAIQNIIEKVVGGTCLRTLSAETIARGCAIMSAMLSPFLQVAQYKVDELHYYTLKYFCQFENETYSQILFDKNCSFPATLQLNSQITSPINISLCYDPQPDGIDHMLSFYKVQGCQPLKKFFSVEMAFELDINGIAKLNSVQLKESDQEIMEIENEKEDENQQKVQENQITYTEIPFTSQEFNCLSQAQFEIAYNFEQQLDQQDLKIQQTADKKNELEAYIYSMRDKLQNKLKNYAEINFTNQFLNQLQLCENWLYDEGSNTQYDNYQKQLDQLKINGDPIENRFQEFENINEEIAKSINILKDYQQLTQTKLPEYAHVSQQQRIKVFADIQKLLEYINSIDKKCQQFKKTQDPSIKSQDITLKIQQFQKTADDIFQKKIDNQDQNTQQEQQEEQKKEESKQAKKNFQPKFQQNQQQQSSKEKKIPKFQPKQQFQDFLQQKEKKLNSNQYNFTQQPPINTQQRPQSQQNQNYQQTKANPSFNTTSYAKPTYLNQQQQPQEQQKHFAYQQNPSYNAFQQNYKKTSKQEAQKFKK